MLANAPEKIGKYDVLGVLGKGGMGIVYKARDPFLDRLVAIKMMTGFSETPDQLQRFYREAKSTASLSHRNIITVFDRGEHDGNPYLVMQFLEGSSLESLIQSKVQMTLFDKINIIVEVCHGLAYAHQREVVHRDIKPANIMVLKDSSVKIVDFGIARMGDTTSTKTGLLMGSLPYMSPEQLNDKVQLDSRTDIYSVGVVLFQLLSGVLPFEGETAASTFGKILFDPPPPLGKFMPSCPPELESIISKVLSKDRDQRYSTADELAVDLAQVRDRLKRDAIDVHLQQAKLMWGERSLLQANEELIEVLKLDKHNTEATTLLSSLRKEIQKEQNAAQIRVLKDQAANAYRKEEFESALGHLDQAIALDSEDLELQKLRTAVQNARLEAEQLRQVLTRAENAHRLGNLDAAKRDLEGLLARRPSDSRAKALYRTIQKDLEERAIQRRLDELLEGARKEMAQHRYTAAVLILNEAEKIDPAAPRLQELIDQLNIGRQQERQRRELEQVTQNVEEALKTDDNQTALELVADGLRKFPGDTGLLRLQILARTQNEAAQQKVFIRNQIAKARELLNSGDAAGAARVIEQSLLKAPGNLHLESLLTTARERLAQDQAVRSTENVVPKQTDARARVDNAGATQILGSEQVRFEQHTSEEPMRQAQEFEREREHGVVPPKLVKQDGDTKATASNAFTSARGKWFRVGLSAIGGLIIVSVAMIYFARHKGQHPPPPPPPPPKMQVHILTNPPDSAVLVNSHPVSGGVIELPVGSNNNIQVSKLGYKTKEMTQKAQQEWNISLEPEPLHVRIITSEKKGTVELDDQMVGAFTEGRMDDLEIPPDDKDHKLSVVVQHKPIFTVRFHTAPGTRPQVSSIDSKDLFAVSSLGSTATAYSGTELKHAQAGDQPIAKITAAGVDLPAISAQPLDLTFGEGTDQRHIAVENDNSPGLLLQTIAANEGTFLIRTEPEDARLTIDGKEIKPKKHQWQIVRAPGSYNFTVSAEGYEPLSLTILLAQGQRLPKILTLTKKRPTSGNLVMIDGTPGSDVLLDGRKLGNLDGNGNGRFSNVPFGRHSVILQKPGFTNRTLEVTFDSSSPDHSFGELKLTAMAGRLVFSVTPKNAIVKYRPVRGDKFMPLTGTAAEVPPGQYEILAQAAGMQDSQTLVTVEPGKDTPVPLNLKPPPSMFEDPAQVTASGDWYRATNSKVTVYLRPGLVNVSLAFSKAKTILGFKTRKVHWQIESADGEEKVIYDLGDHDLIRISVKEGVESDPEHKKAEASVNGQKEFSVHVKVAGKHVTITSESGSVLDDYTAASDLSKGKLGIRTDSLFVVRVGN